MRKTLLIICALLMALPLQAATLKIATVTPEGSTWMKDMRASAAEIKERTAGRVQIKYYGGGVMGNDQKVLSRIRLRSLQGGAFTPSALVSQYNDLNLYGLPMVFDSEEEAAYVRSYGHRGPSEFEFSRPTPAETREGMAEQVQSIRANPIDARSLLERKQVQHAEKYRQANDD